jgi:hypothetical protein
MKATAIDALKALGLQEHQALLVSHNDEPHPHVHLLVNTVNPLTGKTAGLQYSKETLSRWAEAYEREHGMIRCEQRVKNNARRQDLAQERTASRQQQIFQAVAGKPIEKPKRYEPVKDKSPTRPQWFDRQEIIGHIKGMRAGQAVEQKQERDTLGLQHQLERASHDKRIDERLTIIRTNVKETYRPKWKALYRDQAAERRYLTKVATHPLERAAFVIANRERLAPEGKRMTLRDMASLILSPKRLMQRVDRVHDRERRALATVEKNHEKTVAAPHVQRARADWHQMVQRQTGERAALRAHQATQRQEITFAAAKAELVNQQARASFTQAQEGPAPAPRKESRSERIKRHNWEAQQRRDRPDGFERER